MTLCVVCGDSDALVFESYSGGFHSCCTHAACLSCLEKSIEAQLFACRERWQLRLSCPNWRCGRLLPQGLVFRASEPAKSLAWALENSITWPSLDDEPKCPQCGEVKEVFVNKACGHGACSGCWLADLDEKLAWAQENCCLDIPCCHPGCAEGCLDTLQQLADVPEAKAYRSKVLIEMQSFSSRCVHEGAPSTPGPQCSVCGAQSIANLHCSCGHSACRQCWEKEVHMMISWCRESFAASPQHWQHHRSTCEAVTVLSLLSSSMRQPLVDYRRDFEAQLASVAGFAAPRGATGPLCPICGEVRLVLLAPRSHAADHCACEACWLRWAEQQIVDCYTQKRAPRLCLWPHCVAEDRGFWDLLKRHSPALTKLLLDLKRRERLQSNPLYPAGAQVECPRCIGLGYLGFDTVMCFLCEHQWEAEGQQPESLWSDEKEELQVAGLLVRSCPQCHEYIEKNGGCDHMTCRCRFQFSWSTRKPWRSVVG